LIGHCFRRMAIVCAILGGIGVTWAAAGFGYLLLHPRGCVVKVRPGLMRVRETRQGISRFLFDNNRCPTRDDLAGHYVSPRSLVDPWGTSITFHCSSDDIGVRSAGPDRVFHTADDITSD